MQCNTVRYSALLYNAVQCYKKNSQVAQGVKEEDIKEKVYLGESSRSLPTRQGLHVRDYVQDVKKSKKSSNEEKERLRRGSDDEDEDEGSSVSSWMADHVRDCHKGEPLNDFEFACTGTFRKPLHRQVDESLRITRAENQGQIKVGKKVWQIALPLLNRKHEYWAPRTMTCIFTNFNR